MKGRCRGYSEKTNTEAEEDYSRRRHEGDDDEQKHKDRKRKRTEKQTYQKRRGAIIKRINKKDNKGNHMTERYRKVDKGKGY